MQQKKQVPWLKANLHGGYLLDDESSWRKTRGPPVISEQESNIRNHIYQQRENDLTLIVDERFDTRNDCEAMNMVVANREAVYYCDTVFVDI